MKVLFVLACLVAVSLAAPRNELTCDICIDVITDFDEWLTSDKTEQEIVDFISEICAAIGSILPDLEAACNFLIQSQLPAIIDGIVQDNLNPTEVCTNILGACP